MAITKKIKRYVLSGIGAMISCSSFDILVSIFKNFLLTIVSPLQGQHFKNAMKELQMNNEERTNEEEPNPTQESQRTQESDSHGIRASSAARQYFMVIATEITQSFTQNDNVTNDLYCPSLVSVTI